MNLHRWNSKGVGVALAIAAMLPSSCTSKRFGGATLEIQAPFSTAVLEIRPDGAVLYEARSRGMSAGEERDKQTKSKQVGEDDISALVSAIEESNFCTLKESYPKQASSRTDGSTYSIEVKIGRKKRKVICYESECPDAFNRVMEVMKEIWAEEMIERGV